MKKNKRGDAMIMVICIMAVFLALSLAAVFSASSLMSGALKSRAREQCRLSAITFSKMLKEEFEWKTDYEDVEKDRLRDYIRAEMEGGGWAYYNENEAGHRDLDSLKKIFTVESKAVKDLDENIGEIEAAVYWTADTETFSAYKDYRGTTVVVEVTCKKKEQQQTIRTLYTIAYQAYKEDGTVEPTEGWGSEDYHNWKNGTGNYLAWQWNESEVR